MDSQHVLNAIRIARISKNMKQLEVSVLLGISQNYYSEIECGKHKLTLDMLEKIGKVLGKDYREFLPPPPRKMSCIRYLHQSLQLKFSNA